MRMTKSAARTSKKSPATARAPAKPAAKPRSAAPPKAAAKPLRRSEPDRRKVAAKPAAKLADTGLAAVEHAFDLLDVLARLSPVAAATLERETGCPRATVLRLLAALQARGFAVHSEADDHWQLGTRWGVLQQAAHAQGALAAASMPFLAALARATGENVYLRARDGMEAETIAVYQADPVLRVYTEVGKRGPLHAGPARLLLAHAPEPVQTQVLSQRLPRFTPATRTDPTWIAADLQRLRARGYLITADEVNAGAAAQLSRALGGPAGQTITVVPAANGGPLPGAHTSASLPTSPPSPAAWVR
jgi:DNA-binding IclR family transcriptional regulator